jgi:hypothetical protein
MFFISILHNYGFQPIMLNELVAPLQWNPSLDSLRKKYSVLARYIENMGGSGGHC